MLAGSNDTLNLCFWVQIFFTKLEEDEAWHCSFETLESAVAQIFLSCSRCMPLCFHTGQSYHFVCLALYAPFYLSCNIFTEMPPVPFYLIKLWLFQLFLQIFISFWPSTYKNHKCINFDPKFMGLFAKCSVWSLVFYHIFSRIFAWVNFKWH